MRTVKLESGPVAGIAILIFLVGLLLIGILIGVWCTYDRTGKRPRVDVDVDVDVPPAVIDLTCPIIPETLCKRWLYSVPFTCGRAQGRGANPHVVPAMYAFNMVVSNSLNSSVRFRKKISMTLPPGDQTPGNVIISRPPDQLRRCQALEMGCDEIFELLQKRSIPPVIKGVVSVEIMETRPLDSPPLKVWCIQTSARDALVSLPQTRRSEETEEEDSEQHLVDTRTNHTYEPMSMLTRTDALTYDKEKEHPTCLERVVQEPSCPTRKKK